MVLLRQLPDEIIIIRLTPPFSGETSRLISEVKTEQLPKVLINSTPLTLVYSIKPCKLMEWTRFVCRANQCPTM